MVKHEIQITHYCTRQWGVSVIRNGCRMMDKGNMHLTLKSAKSEAIAFAKEYGENIITVMRYIEIKGKT